MPRIPKDNLGSYFCKGQRIANENLRKNWDRVFGIRETPACSRCGSVFGTDSTWRYNGEDWEHKCPKNHPQSGHMILESI